MNEEQFHQFLEHNDKATGNAIEKHVNGHLREMKADLEKHAEQDLKYQEKIDGNIQWVARLIIGAVVVGAIGMLIK